MSPVQPTIIDVAESAGVSNSTFSPVLRSSPRVSDATRIGVLRVVAGLNHRPDAIARGLVRRRILVPDVMHSGLHDPVSGKAPDGIEARAQAAGYPTLASTGEWFEPRNVVLAPSPVVRSTTAPPLHDPDGAR